MDHEGSHQQEETERIDAGNPHVLDHQACSTCYEQETAQQNGPPRREELPLGRILFKNPPIEKMV
jgi:hypothetical protein